MAVTDPDVGDVVAAGATEVDGRLKPGVATPPDVAGGIDPVGPSADAVTGEATRLSKLSAAKAATISSARDMRTRIPGKTRLI
jgi:hypothetical protein